MKKRTTTLLLTIVLTASILLIQDTPRILEEDGETGNVEYYNRHPEREFFSVRLGSPNERAFNGGVGNGLVSAYFAGGQDEANAYRLWHGLEPEGDPNARTAANMGTYQFYGYVDECRRGRRFEGHYTCGDVFLDGKQLVIGYPTHATNLHPWGTPRTFSHTVYQENPNVSDAPRFADHPAWLNRNFIDGGVNDGFTYSRFLIGQVDWPNWENPETIQSGARMGVEIAGGVANQYHFAGSSRPFVDIPWHLHHQRWGFTCPGIARTGIYRRFNMQYAVPEAAVDPSTLRGLTHSIEEERFVFYRDSLVHAANRLGAQIAAGTYGNLYTGLYAASTRARRQMVGNV